jgi:ATP-dependent RNA/DNA helicase IGHMBP2
MALSGRGGHFASPEEELGRLAEALVLEQREQQERMRIVLRESSLAIRRKERLSWSPVEVKDMRFAARGRQILTLSPVTGGGEPHAFRVGASVEVYPAEVSDEKPVRGVVRRAKALEIEVVFDRSDFDAQSEYRKWTVDACHDERTFAVMAMALNRWINEDKQERVVFRDMALGYRPVDQSSARFTSISSLNELQARAVCEILAQPKLMLLQGPPGTGKTTTLVHAIAGLVQSGEQVLATAASNAAVDVLAKKCIEAGLKTVRIGNPIRIDDDVAKNSLESLVERDVDYKRVRDLRRRAEDAWREATRYRRNFDSDARAERKMARDDAKELQAAATDLERAIEERAIRNADVVCSTLTGTADYDLRPFHFPVVVVDEAGQALEPLIWSAMLKADRLVLAGDPQQLPPVVHDAAAAALGLDVSLLEKRMARSSEAFAPEVVLQVQYRMNAGIMGTVNDYFYEGKLLADELVTQRQLSGCSPWTLIDTAGCGFEEQRDAEGESKVNPDEAAFVAARLVELRSRFPSASIGVIAPYRAQVQAIESAWGEPDAGMDISTVDSFQGQERDIIVLSLTRSNSEGEIGFLSEHRRTNVAMSRARKHLLVVGDSSTLGADDFFGWLVERSEAEGAYKSAWEFL